MDDILSFGNNPWRLTDNRHGSILAKKICGESYDFLHQWSEVNIKQWQEFGVSIFTKERYVQDHSEQSPLFSLGKDENSQWINTHNCMGVVKLRDKNSDKSIQIEIGSRFDSDSGNQFFLTYLLSKAFGGSFIDLIEVGKDSLWDLLLAFAFRRALDKAVRLGLFKQYQSFQHNDLRIRGRINVARQLRENVPFVGKVAYTTRDITYDNPTNHLIRYALTKLNQKWGNLFGRDHRLNELRRQLEQNTPTWHWGKLLSCLRKKENLNPIKHPYYQNAYEPLRTLSLSILRDEGASLYQNTQEAEGVIFDGSWLWEQYLWTLLKPLEFEHTDNKSKIGGWKPIEGITYYPDFFHRDKRVVLDAKYKQYDKSSDSYKSDARQVFAYMFVLDAIHGGLIKPGEGSCQEKIKRLGMNPPSAAWHDLSISPAKGQLYAGKFNEEMETRENEFLKTIKELLK